MALILDKTDPDYNRLAYEILSNPRRVKHAFTPPSPEEMAPPPGAEGVPPEGMPPGAPPPDGMSAPPPPGSEAAPALPPGAAATPSGPGGGLLPPEIMQTITDTATQAAQQAMMAGGAQGGAPGAKGPGAAKVTPEMLYQVMGRVLTTMTAMAEGMNIQLPSAGMDDLRMQEVGMTATGMGAPGGVPGAPGAPPAPGGMMPPKTAGILDLYNKQYLRGGYAGRRS